MKNWRDGFSQPADGIVPCACGAKEGEPCKPTPKDKGRLQPGYVHFGRRVRRLLLTAKATAEEREELEAQAMKILDEWLKEIGTEEGEEE